MEDLFIKDGITIPSEAMEVSAVRSSGPGGQNVNKVSTCIELRFYPQKCEQLSGNVIMKLLELCKNKLDSDNAIIITSQKYREQFRNLEDARDKLKSLVLEALKVKKKRKPTKPTKSSIEERIQSKRINSLKKASRSKNFDE